MKLNNKHQTKTERILENLYFRKRMQEDLLRKTELQIEHFEEVLENEKQDKRSSV